MTSYNVQLKIGEEIVKKSPAFLCSIMTKSENLMKTSEFLTFKIKFFRGIFIVMNLKSLNLIFRYHLRVAPFLKLNAVSIFLHHLGNWENKARLLSKNESH